MTTIRCAQCKRNVAAGAEAQKMVVEYRQSDGTTKVFGHLMSDGPLTKATGRLLRGFHSRCFWALHKREARGDAVTGSVLPGMPTGYEIAALVPSQEEFEALGLSEEQAATHGTAGLGPRLTTLRELARTMGRAVGDATVHEAFWAHEHGGPYPHTHRMRLDQRQLRPHLLFAHGWDFDHDHDGEAQQTHDAIHAWAALKATRAARAADPGHRTPPEHDWRSQVEVDVEHLRPGGGRS